MRILLHIKHPLVVFFIVILLGAISGVTLLEVHFTDKFSPRVVLGGENMVGKSYKSVKAHVDRVGDALRRDGFQLILKSRRGDQVISIPAQSVGLTSDVVVEYFALGDYDDVLEKAFARGHTGNFWTRSRDRYRLVVEGHEAHYGNLLREDTVRALIAREVKELLDQPVDAHFVFGASTVTLSADRSGEQIDIDAVMQALRVALRTMKTNRLEVKVTEVPARITAARLAAVKDFASALGAAGLFKLRYNGSKIVYASGGRLASWLTIDPNQPGVVLKIAADQVRQFAEEFIESDLPDAPRNSRFAMVNGKLIETVPGVIGSAVDVGSLTAQLEAIVNARYVAMLFGGQSDLAKTTEVTVTFQKQFPKITSSTIAQYNIAELVGSATTSFRGSTEARIKNITIGVDRVGGILLKPGEEFSLVTALGEVSEETGFEKEYVIKGDRSIKEAGGGLCQLATTVFRGALDAGLPITERQNHSYVVGYYGPGLDATIYGPHPDVKFVNDTGHYVLFQMRVDGTNLITELYGTRDDRAATTTAPVLSQYIDPPPDKFVPDPEAPWGQITCTDSPRKGVTADATTTVTYADGTVRTQVFHSVYQPWPKICLVGIKTK